MRKKIAKAGRHRFFKLKIVRVLLWCLLAVFLFFCVQMVAYRFVSPPYTWLMLERKFLPDPGKEIEGIRHTSVEMEDISKSMVFAVMASEDQGFLEHNGLDLEAIEKAIKHNKNHKRKRGASTISQQTAKNAFLWETRSWVRKGLEIPFTLGIEGLWGKRRILEVYLNIAEFGPGVFGVEAASQYWFHVSAKRLSQRQAALLAACLPAPRKFNPRNPSAFVSRRADWIEQQMEFMDQGLALEELGLKQKKPPAKQGASKKKADNSRN
jgi:monofunctional biosynthetic peptidoglycan transglycosylase